MKEPDDNLLMAALAEAFAPEPAPPNPDDLARLHQALAIRSNGHGAYSDESARIPSIRRVAFRGWAVQVRRLRHPVAVLAVVGVLATGGVATAAVATNTLPGPTRTVAFDLGLPVSSPDLVATQACLTALQTALVSRDAAEVSTEANSLRRDLAALSPAELKEVELEANQLLVQSSDFLASIAAAARGENGSTTNHAQASSAAPAQPVPEPSSQSLEGGTSVSGGDGGSSDGGTSVSGGDGGGTSVSGGDGGGTSVSGGDGGGTSVSGGDGGGSGDGGPSVSGGDGGGSDGGTSVSVG
jgi:hypothetical protein